MVRAVILGSDTLLAARPAAPMQLLHACLRYEFDFVAPVSWGDELLAVRAGEWLRRQAEPAVIVAHCPFVAEALRTVSSTGATCLTGVAPPVATARYVRHLLAPRTVHVVHAGACPGATGPEIDEILLPEVLLAALADAGIVLTEEPHELESRLPPVRARYASLPGGVPDPEWLRQAAGVTYREVAPLTLAVAPLLPGGDRSLLDLQAACGCACARDRFAVSRLEPPRATAPVVGDAEVIDLRDGAWLGVPEAGRVAWRVVDPEAGGTAVAGATGPAARDVPARDGAPRLGGVSPPAPAGFDGQTTRMTPERLTAVVEPWLTPTAPAAPARSPGSRTNGAPSGGAPGNEPRARAVDPAVEMRS
ncbi:MAG TPA: hypothetical protein VLE53_19920 [Gemmatimonadaceae bacterium]|nr:hypothetical protein [Gemmatimonadaceae bacterium]